MPGLNGAMGAMYDVIISGGGPAGTNAAYYCTKAGLNTLIVEKKEVPRQKCCAGGFLERASRSLSEPLPDDIIEKEIRGVTFVANDEQLDYRLSKRIAVTVKREKLDTYLLRRAEKAGAELRTRCEVSKVVDADGHMEVNCGHDQLRTKVLIVAEGANSRTANNIFGPLPNGSLAIGMAKNISLRSDPGDSLTLYLWDRPGGWQMRRDGPPPYGWMFPRKNEANIGIGGMGVSTEFFTNALNKIEQRTLSECGGYGAQRGANCPSHTNGA